MAARLAVLCLVTVTVAMTVATHTGCSSTLCFSVFSTNINVDFNPFKRGEPKPIENLIRQSGYSVESHEILTEDGYFLTYHRISRGKASNKSVPVLVQHGLLGASACWVMSKHSLAFTLADAGYDVWLGNARGNTYSRKHVKLDPDTDKKEFWDFSWHEMGYYDLPASIDYILQDTGKSQLLYIGHSMGTTMYFVLGATRPEYMSKVQAAFLMAPVAYPWHIRSPLAKFLTKLNKLLNVIVKALGVYEVLPHSTKFFWLDQNICARPSFQFICRDILFYFAGVSEKELNRTSLPTVLEYVPAGASYKQFRHFRQITEEGANFQEYDHGYVMNLWKYGSPYPPEYDLSRVDSPLYIYYAMNDWLAVPEDVLHAVKHLPNVQRVTRVAEDEFNHFDFMWAIDAKTLVYDNIIHSIQHFV